MKLLPNYFIFLTNILTSIFNPFGVLSWSSTPLRLPEDCRRLEALLPPSVTRFHDVPPLSLNLRDRRGKKEGRSKMVTEDNLFG